MTPLATILELSDDATRRVLAPGRIRRFYLLMLPAPLSVLFCGFGGWLSYTESEWLVLGVGLLAAGVALAAAYMAFETWFIGVLPARCYLRWLRERIDQRADAVVSADDPDAFFVQHIPESKWGVTLGENAGDVGLIRIDYSRRVLLYEGDVERWMVPAESIVSVKLQSFTPPNGAEALLKHTVVMLKVRIEPEGETLVTPLAAHPLQWRAWTPARRRRGAHQLRAAIRHLMDPKRWPRPEREQLDQLLPPLMR